MKRIFAYAAVLVVAGSNAGCSAADASGEPTSSGAGSGGAGAGASAGSGGSETNGGGSVGGSASGGNAPVGPTKVVPVGEPFLLLDAYTPSTGGDPRVVPLGPDGFVVTLGDHGEILATVSATGEVAVVSELEYGGTHRVAETGDGGALVVWVDSSGGDFFIHGFRLEADGSKGAALALPQALGVFPYTLFDASFDGSVVHLGWGMDGYPTAAKSRLGAATLAPDGTLQTFVVRDVAAPLYADHLACGAARCVVASHALGPSFTWAGSGEPQPIALPSPAPEVLTWVPWKLKFRNGKFATMGGAVDPSLCGDEPALCIRTAVDVVFDPATAGITEEPVFELDTLGAEDRNYGFEVDAHGGRLVGWWHDTPSVREVRLRSHADAGSLSAPGILEEVGVSNAGRFLVLIQRDDAPSSPPPPALWAWLVELAPL